MIANRQEVTPEGGKKKRNRAHWVSPVNADRSGSGAFGTLFPQLLTDDRKFSDYFRMSHASFMELCQILRQELQRKDTLMRQCIPVEERIAATLRYLATGCTVTELHNTYRIGVSTLSGIIHDVCLKIWSLMKPACMPEPTADRWRRIADGFRRNLNFPNCLGVVGGKTLKNLRPAIIDSEKTYLSVVLLAVCDSEYKFTHVDVVSCKRDADCNIFENSALNRDLKSNRLDLPAPCRIGSSPPTEVPFVFVGDERFWQSKYMLRPYSGKITTLHQKVFNYRLSRVQRCVDSAFGILIKKWRILQSPLNTKAEHAVNIVKACFLLHNFVLSRDGYAFEDSLTCELPGISFQNVQTGVGQQPMRTRQFFADYFVGEGSIDLQHKLGF